MFDIQPKFQDMKRLSEIIHRKMRPRNIEPDDMFQEGCLAYTVYGNMMSAIGAMKQVCMDDIADYSLLKEVGSFYNELKTPSAALPDIENLKLFLGGDEFALLQRYLLGESLSKIGGDKHHNSVIKRKLLRIMVKVAEFYGKIDIDFSTCFEPQRLYPKGITKNKYGKYRVNAGRGGKAFYLGSFKKLEDAIEAKTKWDNTKC